MDKAFEKFKKALLEKAKDAVVDYAGKRSSYQQHKGEEVAR